MEVADQLPISYSAIHEIIHNVLSFSEICAR